MAVPPPVHRAVPLADGVVDIHDSGPRDAPAVVALDGYGSRLLAALAVAPASRVGARIIGVDRPGYWGSTPRPGDPMSTWPVAFAELLDALEIEGVALLGSSAGCPLAFAAAAADDRIHRVAIVGPMCPFVDAGQMADMQSSQRRTFRFAARAPALGAASMRMMGVVGRRAPSVLLRQVARQRPPVDAQRMASPGLRDLMLASVPGLMGRAAGADLRAMVGDWRHAVEGTHQPVRVWFGTEDAVHPKSMADGLVRRLPDGGSVPVDGGFFDCTDRLDEVLSWAIGRPGESARRT